MPPHTPLGIINGNRQYNKELTLYERGKIVGTCNAGAIFIFTIDLVKCDPTIARSILLLDPERLNNHTKPRKGRLRLYDVRFERRILRLARWNPKIIYKDIKDSLDTFLLRDTLR
jgi:hypothetical protein